MVSIRLNKQENTNPIYISGNTFDLGSYNTLKVMSIIRKKTSLFIDESYWEKLILLPMDFSSDLFYNFYEFDKENKCILVNEMNFSANLLEDLRFPSFENLWSPQISPKKKLSNFKVATLSPFKLLAARNIGNNMTINMNKNKPKRIEKKFNYFIVYNELNEMNSFIKELNNEIIIGVSSFLLVLVNIF